MSGRMLTYTFPEGNRIRYGQDMHFMRGVPAGVVFWAEALRGTEKVKLTAPGYGYIDNYGNGALCINRCDLPPSDSTARHITEDEQERNSTQFGGTMKDPNAIPVWTPERLGRALWDNAHDETIRYCRTCDLHHACYRAVSNCGEFARLLQRLNKVDETNGESK